MGSIDSDGPRFSARIIGVRQTGYLMALASSFGTEEWLMATVSRWI